MPQMKNSNRPDPAPSRWSWRMQRLMLTPAFRLFLRAGLPFCIAAGAMTFYLADTDRRIALQTKFSDLRNSIETRPEFMVALMAVDGAGVDVAEDIREVVQVEFPVSSFDLDLEAIRASIAALDPVRTVSVRIRPGGVLQVDLTERQPAILWRRDHGLELLDMTGNHIAMLEARRTRPDLSVIAGDGADKHVTQALHLIRAAQPLGNRLRGLVRMGERRWDVVLDRDQRIMLPEEKPVQALERVIALSQAQDILERDLAVVDMRLGLRPTLRMNQSAVQEWWRIRQISEQAEN